MSITLFIFSLGDYSADTKGLTEAKSDGATAMIVTDIDGFGQCVYNANTVACKLGHEICIVLEHRDNIYFYTADNINHSLRFPASVDNE